jgi:hypothetical protein
MIGRSRHVVVHSAARVTGQVQCDDRALNTKCQFLVLDTIMISPERAVTVSRIIRSECDSPV